MAPVKVLIVPGSNRSASLNVKLAGHIARELSLLGADATRISLADYPMPIYDGDDEAANGIPEPARKLIAQFKAHDAVVIVSPEYNGSIPGLLKNTIDWMSRDGVAPFRDRVFAIAAASPGALGGMRRVVAEITAGAGDRAAALGSCRIRGRKKRNQRGKPLLRAWMGGIYLRQS